MAEINEILSKEAVQGILSADKLIVDFDNHTLKFIETVKQLNDTLGKNSTSAKEYEKAVKASVDAEKQHVQATQKKTQADREAEKASKKLAEQQAKAAQKLKEHNEALAMDVKTVADAIRQNKALTIERNKTATSLGKQ